MLTHHISTLFPILFLSSAADDAAVEINDTSAWSCQQLTLNAGEWLYMPRGIPHMAHTGQSEGSLHATVAVTVEGFTWRDAAMQGCRQMANASSQALCSQIQQALMDKRLNTETLKWADLIGDEELQRMLSGAAGALTDARQVGPLATAPHMEALSQDQLTGFVAAGASTVKVSRSSLTPELLNSFSPTTLSPLL